MNKFLVIIVALLIPCVDARSEDEYQVTTEGRLLQLTTPYGTKIFFGNEEFSNLPNYQFEIPIKDLIPNALASEKKSNKHHGLENREDGGSDPNSYSEDTDQLILRANGLYNDGKFNEALTFIEEVLHREPTNTRAWIMKGSLMHAQGQRDLAIKSWQHALELEPSNERIKNILKNYGGSNP